MRITTMPGIRRTPDQCFSINNIETTWAEDLLISKYGQLKVLTEGGDANMNTADFNWCYE
jgi:hypothetical protein